MAQKFRKGSCSLTSIPATKLHRTTTCHDRRLAPCSLLFSQQVLKGQQSPGRGIMGTPGQINRKSAQRASQTDYCPNMPVVLRMPRLSPPPRYPLKLLQSSGTNTENLYSCFPSSSTQPGRVQNSKRWGTGGRRRWQYYTSQMLCTAFGCTQKSRCSAWTPPTAPRNPLAVTPLANCSGVECARPRGARGTLHTYCSCLEITAQTATGSPHPLTNTWLPRHLRSQLS